uniref:NADH-ubiquinone oxidoreductase chain 6 n=1 Tax=Micromorphus albipes TaxID=1000630 RepID=A0A7D7AG73_9MUSC|nr:NADH dehydrogenase subunit 6 [Micromorphus albipes]
MIQFMINMSIILTSFIFMQMNHPLAMGLMLLLQTLLICLTTGLMSKSFWFSYILFLVFLGGMLVLFIYVTSLASNEMFSMSMKMTWFIMIMYLMIFLILMMTDLNMFNLINENSEIKSMLDSTIMMKENTMTLNKIYNFPSNMMTIILMNYLLLTLIAVVKITNVFYGPLRQMN